MATYPHWNVSFADQPDQPLLEPLARLIRSAPPATRPAAIVVEPEKFTFGKHSGKYIQDVAATDSQYLVWLLDQQWVKPQTRQVVEKALKKNLVKAA